MNQKKKRIFALILAISLGSIPFGPTPLALAAGPNLVQNPSFDTAASGNAGQPANWGMGSWGTNTPTFTYPVAGNNDASAAKVQIANYSSGDAKWHFDPVPVTPGEIYTYTDDYMASIQSNLTVDFKLANGTDQYAWVADLPAAATWTKAQGTITVPANVVSMTVFHLINGNGNLTIDNVSVTKNDSTTPPPTPPPTPTPTSTDPNNLIPNGNMETAGTGAPLGWLKNSWGTNTPTFTYPVAGNGSASAAKLQITGYSSGDAKWYFAPIAVTPGDVLNFSDSYLSDAPSNLTAEFQMSNGSYQYAWLSDLPVAAAWAKANASITVPSGATKMTVFHLLSRIGSLTIDDAVLQKTVAPPPPPPQDPSNLIPNAALYPSSDASIPLNWFKAGWGTNQTAYTYPATGYNGANGLKVQINSYTNGDSKWAFEPVAVTPGKIYTYSDYYQSNVPSYITVQYDKGNGNYSYADIMAPAASAAWAPVSVKISPPAGTQNMTVFHLINRVGWLATSAFMLTESTGSSVLTQGMVSFSFDDGYASQYDVARPILNAAGIKGTFYIVSGFLDGSDPFYMDTTQMLAMNADGHEIGSHTRNHEFLSQLTTAQMQSEIAGAKADLLALGATPVDTLAYPYGDYSAAVVDEVKAAGYAGARSVNSGYNDKLADRYLLMDQHVENSTTLAEVKSYVDTALANKTWLILELHQQDYSGDQYSNTPEMLQAIVDYVKQKNAKTVTVSEGLKIIAQ